MSYRVLPALSVVSVIRERVGDELVDIGQSCHATRRVLDGHRDQSDVRVRWLDVVARCGRRGCSSRRSPMLVRTATRWCRSAATLPDGVLSVTAAADCAVGASKLVDGWLVTMPRNLCRDQR